MEVEKKIDFTRLGECVEYIKKEVIIVACYTLFFYFLLSLNFLHFHKMPRNKLLL